VRVRQRVDSRPGVRCQILDLTSSANAPGLLASRYFIRWGVGSDLVAQAEIGARAASPGVAELVPEGDGCLADAVGAGEGVADQRTGFVAGAGEPWKAAGRDYGTSCETERARCHAAAALSCPSLQAALLAGSAASVDCYEKQS
jgi:hypothetical protein